MGIIVYYIIGLDGLYHIIRIIDVSKINNDIRSKKAITNHTNTKVEV